MSNTIECKPRRHLGRAAVIGATVPMLAVLSAVPSFATTDPNDPNGTVSTAVGGTFSSATGLLTGTLIPAVFALIGIVTLFVLGWKYAMKARKAGS